MKFNIRPIKSKDYTEFKKNLNRKTWSGGVREAIKENDLCIVHNAFGVFWNGALQGILRYSIINPNMIDIEYVKGLYEENKQEVEEFCFSYMMHMAKTGNYKTVTYSGEDYKVRQILFNKGFVIDPLMWPQGYDVMRLNFTYDRPATQKLRIMNN